MLQQTTISLNKFDQSEVRTRDSQPIKTIRLLSSQYSVYELQVATAEFIPQNSKWIAKTNSIWNFPRWKSRIQATRVKMWIRSLVEIHVSFLYCQNLPSKNFHFPVNFSSSSTSKRNGKHGNVQWLERLALQVLPQQWRRWHEVLESQAEGWSRSYHMPCPLQLCLSDLWGYGTVGSYYPLLSGKPGEQESNSGPKYSNVSSVFCCFISMLSDLLKNPMNFLCEKCKFGIRSQNVIFLR